MSFYNRTISLPDGVMCSCGSRGEHEQTHLCPQEAVNYHQEWIEEFDPTVLRYHTEDDPVTSALLDRFLDLRHSYLAMRAMMVVSSVQRSQAEKSLRAELDAQKQQNKSMSARWQESDKAVSDMRLQVVQLQDKLAQMRRLFEEVAGQLGLVQRPGAFGDIISDESWNRLIASLSKKPLDQVDAAVKKEKKKRG